MWIRYLSFVVSPMMRMSSRTRKPRSVSAAADPEFRAWIPSIARTISPLESFTSFRRPTKFFSNSPWDAELERIDVRSSSRIRLPGRNSTLPSYALWAREKMTEVLPTPGSPTRTGVFLLRRDSSWTTSRISRSRPMTTGRSPLLAFSVRSMQNRPVRPPSRGLLILVLAAADDVETAAEVGVGEGVALTTRIPAR